MQEFDHAVLQCFLEKQLQLFPEKVAETEEDAEDFLIDCIKESDEYALIILGNGAEKESIEEKIKREK